MNFFTLLGVELKKIFCHTKLSPTDRKRKHPQDSMVTPLRLSKKHRTYHHACRKHEPCHSQESLYEEILSIAENKKVYVEMKKVAEEKGMERFTLYWPVHWQY